jgi:replicative DNA helicase
MQYTDAIQEKVLSMLLSPDVNKPAIISLLRPEYFTDYNKDLYSACQLLYRESKPIDTLSVFKKLRDLGKKADPIKLAELSASGIFETSHLRHYVSELHSVYKRKKLEEIQQNLMKDFDIPRAFDEFTKLNSDDLESATQDVHSAAVNYAIKLAKMKDGSQVIDSTKTHLRALDAIVNGFTAPDFIILGGRPAHGKTTLAMQIALNQAQNEQPIGFITMEMSAEQLTGRLLSNLSEVDGKKFINVKDNLSVHEINQLAAQADKLKNTNLYIADLPDADPIKIEAEISKMIRQYNIKGVYVDYLQLVSPMHEDKNKGKTEQMTNISKQFKAICKRQNIWICLISSLSRKVEERTDKRPFMADLRESGQLEYDADKVMFTYRPAAYMEESDSAFGDAKDVMEVLVRKNRNGELGVAVLSTKLQYTKVMDYKPKAIDFPKNALNEPKMNVIRRDWNNE